MEPFTVRRAEHHAGFTSYKWPHSGIISQGVLADTDALLMQYLSCATFCFSYNKPLIIWIFSGDLAIAELSAGADPSLFDCMPEDVRLGLPTMPAGSYYVRINAAHSEAMMWDECQQTCQLGPCYRTLLSTVVLMALECYDAWQDGRTPEDLETLRQRSVRLTSLLYRLYSPSRG